MGALLQVYRPVPMLGDTPGDTSLSDRIDHLVVVNLRGSLKPSLTLPAFKLVAHDRYPRHPMLVPIGSDGEVVICGRSGNFAGGDVTPGWCEAVEEITGGVSDLVAIYDDGFKGDAA